MKAPTPNPSAPRTRLTARAALLLLAALGLTPLHAATTRHVWPDSPSPAPPYDTWATAAHAIQQAVDIAVDGDLVLVTNGMYSSISVNRSVTLQSVNGAGVTLINGQRAGRCATLGGQAVLNGFTLTNGVADYGGGVYGGTLSNCVLAGNSASFGGGAADSTLGHCVLAANSAMLGGGALASTLTRCTLTGNSAVDEGGGTWRGRLDNCMLTGNAADFGGGVYGGALTNCTVAGNSAQEGGGVVYGTLYNSIVYYNTAPQGPNYAAPSTVNYSCTTPLPTNGLGNLAAEPEFLDQAAGDLHLGPTSPCIDTGTNLSAILTTDLEDHPRPLDGNGDGTAA